MEEKHSLHTEISRYYGEYRSNTWRIFSFSILKIGNIWHISKLININKKIQKIYFYIIVATIGSRNWNSGRCCPNSKIRTVSRFLKQNQQN